MDANAASPRSMWLARPRLQELFRRLQELGYQLVGPMLQQNAVVYDYLDSVDQLPWGWTDEQAPGHYRVVPGDQRSFGFVVGPHSWKQFLFPPEALLSSADLRDGGWEFRVAEDDSPPLALIGVRACELAALRIQDRVFLSGPYVDPVYQQRRQQSLIVAVNCDRAAATCFCSSTNTGPEVTSGFDLALTEVDDGYTLDVATPEGRDVLSPMDLPLASLDQLQEAATARQRARQQIERELITAGLREDLLSQLEHPHWDEIAARCLSCANCTMVCPTCFCSSIREVNDLTSAHTERHRQWDSCFNFEFSYMNGGVVRTNTRSRYRQWLTHKLATWHDQFGTSGCVGCGRCITWCPVEIDLTQEVAALRSTP